MIGLSIDPGMSNGACLFTFGDDEPFTPIKLWQFPRGAEGLRLWAEYVELEPKYRLGHLHGEAPISALYSGAHLDALVVEKFTPRQNEEFKLTQDSVEPLRGEGALIGRGLGPLIQWAEPSQQYFIGSPDLPKAEKRKLSKAFLETNGLKIVGSMVGNKDAEDAISAELHAIAWLRRQRHMPTMRALFGRKES